MEVLKGLNALSQSTIQHILGDNLGMERVVRSLYIDFSDRIRTFIKMIKNFSPKSIVVMRHGVEGITQKQNNSQRMEVAQLTSTKKSHTVKSNLKMMLI